MKKRQWIFGGMLLMALLFGGCQSPEFYQERAVDRAREYLLKKSTTLTPLQREYVKFNKPLIMSETLLGDPGEGVSAGGDEISPHSRVHFNIAWVIPGKKEIHMVFGVSEPSMAMWYPERLIVKEFIQPDKKRDGAIKAGRRFVLNTLLDLELGNINRVRFSEPGFVQTTYKLELNYKARGITELEAEALTKLTQCSLVWDGIVPGEKIIAVGLGQPDLAGWKPMISLFTSEADLRLHIKPEEKAQETPKSQSEPGLESELEPGQEIDKDADKKPEVKKAPAPPKPEVERLLEELVEEKKADDQ
jgi:hypothetical protein